MSELAHDHVPELKTWVVVEKKKKNAYDTYHGMTSSRLVVNK